MTAAGATALGYDGRGNLISSGSSSYDYTSENRLATTGSGAYLANDAIGRLGQVYANGGANVTPMDYDGQNLITEMNGSNALVRRYVHGPGSDEPLVWYEGAGTTDRRWLHADERGSVIAVSNSAGSVISINAYDEYGIPAPTNIGRFGYTGQTWLSEVGLNYYKARMYSPTLGRFMQTDPIGYGDGINWYDYVDGDPVNRTDPTGLRNKPCEADCISRVTGSRQKQKLEVLSKVTSALSNGRAAQAAATSAATKVAGASVATIKGSLKGLGPAGAGLALVSEGARATAESKGGKPTGEAIAGAVGRGGTSIGVSAGAGTLAAAAAATVVSGGAALVLGGIVSAVAGFGAESSGLSEAGGRGVENIYNNFSKKANENISMHYLGE